MASKERKKRQPSSAREKALALLAHHDHSRAQLRNKLLARGYAEEEVDEAEGKCLEWGYLDDRAFGEKLLRFRALSRGWSPLRARGELVRRGLGSDLAQEIVAAFYAPQTIVEAAQRALTLWSRSHPIQSEQDQSKALSHLSRSGFDFDVARQAVSACLEGLEKE